MNDQKPDFAYVAYQECGCMVAAMVDGKSWRKDTAKEVASWIRDGLTVQRIPTDQVLLVWDCPHKQPMELQPLLFGEES